ncbi:hypothetical protein EFK50_20750 [Nocardioides marmoriginsengisoli]|uniref:Glycoprotein n=1 Tax=Nocardioides marmoriginsengisoli TaxID=661483 RepID=A0A3N0CBB0_9ACTN|nr:hypothetical protein EFK50_20750 [Nocardioides marmoriginsengisoli]
MAGLLALLIATLLPVLAGSPALAADPAAEATPLTVRLVRMTPAALPSKGKVVFAGTVSNDSESAYTAVNLHPFMSSTPIRTRAELATAADSDPATDVGTRLVEPGQFAALGDLAPGQTVTFRIALPVKDLPVTTGTGEAGVYWIGLHALGQDHNGVREVIGRARTFIPLVKGSRTTTFALVVPVREQVRRDADGRVLGTTRWSDALAPTGRLGRLGGFIASAGGRAATLLIDPSVLDAVADLKEKNPPLSLGDGEPEETPSPSATPSPNLSRSVNRLDPADLANADAWLSTVTAAARTHTVLGLGYADPDVSALSRRRPSMLELSTKLAATTFGNLDIAAVPAVAPADGWLAPDALERIAPESMVLLSDQGRTRYRQQWRTGTDQDLVFADGQAASGGPGPTEPTDALALRQRIISDAALRSRTGAPGPLVVDLPANWDPGPAWQLADFFTELDTDWLDLVPLSGSTDLSTPTYTGDLPYAADQRREELGTANISAARTLVVTTSALNNLLRSKNTVGHDLSGIALNAVSLHARRDARSTRDQVGATNARMRATLGKVQVLGTDFVTLSGGSGTLAVTLVNGLDQPITVGVEPRVGSADVTIESAKPLEMAPGQRTVLRLKTEASRIGVTQVVLTPVTENGTAIGSPLTFSLRTSQVGKLIWIILLAGGLLLIVMIARRIRRAVRDHHWRRA